VELAGAHRGCANRKPLLHVRKYVKVAGLQNRRADPPRVHTYVRKVAGQQRAPAPRRRRANVKPYFRADITIFDFCAFFQRRSCELSVTYVYHYELLCQDSRRQKKLIW
jgi:hypothetical protein